VCPHDEDPDQVDSDADGRGDVCDGCPDIVDTTFEDFDGDGITDVCDKCRFVPSLENDDRDLDNVGDACDGCPSDFDPFQIDSDGDGAGDACDVYVIRGGGSVTDGCSSVPGSPLTPALLAGHLFVLAALARRKSPSSLRTDR
jgi:hypothetical protein